MEFIRWAAITALTTLTLQAQAPAAPPDSGPNMEQTVGFINDSFAKQGDLMFRSSEGNISKYTDRSVRLENGCSLVVSSTEETIHPDPLRKSSDHKGTHKSILYLDRADPRTVSVVSSDQLSPTAYGVEIQHAISKWQALNIQPDTSAETLPADYQVDGIVRTISGPSLTIVSDDGKLVALRLISNAHGTQVLGAGLIAATITDIAEGDRLLVNGHTSAPKSKMPSIQYLSLFKNSSVEGMYFVAQFTDKDLADRVAKAIIHAIVLCHKDEKPSLF